MYTNHYVYYIYSGMRERGQGREIYFKDLVHAIVGADKSEICSTGYNSGKN